jgi:predicted transcriptional regulator
MLLLSREKKSKTSILYGAITSLSMCQNYFRVLIDKNLLHLNEGNGRSYYETTEKGYMFLECFQEIQDFLRTDQNKKTE